ncbi:MAG: hypothetical protein JRF53_00700 [Deltaproteobacteria bacterium]|nr:hypothetical protein [Deltaproteobacteria bacterium]
MLCGICKKREGKKYRIPESCHDGFMLICNDCGMRIKARMNERILKRGYITDDDLLADFIDQNCLIDPAWQTRTWGLYVAFREWFTTNISRSWVPSWKKFNKLMTGRFEKRRRGVTFYKGLRLLT